MESTHTANGQAAARDTLAVDWDAIEKAYRDITTPPSDAFTIREMAKNLDIRYEQARYRVKKLVKNGTIDQLDMIGKDGVRYYRMNDD